MKRQKTVESKVADTSRLSSLFSDLPVPIWRNIRAGLDWNEVAWLFRASKDLQERKTGILARDDLKFDLRQKSTVRRLEDAKAFETQIIQPSRSSLRVLRIVLNQLSQLTDEKIEARLVDLVQATPGLKHLGIDFPYLSKIADQHTLAATTHRWSTLVSNLLKRVPVSLEGLCMWDVEGVSSTIVSQFDSLMLTPLWNRSVPLNNLRALVIEATDNIIRTDPVPQVVVTQDEFLNRLLPGISKTIEELALPLANITDDLFVRMAKTPCPELTILRLRIWKTIPQTGELHRSLESLKDEPLIQAKTIRMADESTLRLFEGVSKVIETYPRLGFFRTFMFDFKQGMLHSVSLNAPFQAKNSASLKDPKNHNIQLECGYMFHQNQDSDLVHQYLYRLIQGLGIAQRCAKVVLIQNGCKPLLKQASLDVQTRAVLLRLFGSKVLRGLFSNGNSDTEWTTSDDVENFCSLFPLITELSDMRVVRGDQIGWFVVPTTPGNTKQLHVRLTACPADTLKYWGPRVHTLTLTPTGPPHSPADILNTYPLPNLVRLNVNDTKKGNNFKEMFQGLREDASPLQVMDVYGRASNDDDVLRDWAAKFRHLNRLSVHFTTNEWPHPTANNIFHTLRNFRSLILMSKRTLPTRAMNWNFKPAYFCQLIQSNPGLETLLLDTSTIQMERLPVDDVQAWKGLLMESKQVSQLRIFQARWNHAKLGLLKLDQLEAMLQAFPKLELFDLSLDATVLSPEERLASVNNVPEGYGPLSPAFAASLMATHPALRNKRVRVPGGLPWVAKIPFYIEDHEELIQAQPWESRAFVEEKTYAPISLALAVEGLLGKMSEALARVLVGANLMTHSWGYVVQVSEHQQIISMLPSVTDPFPRIIVGHDSRRFELVNSLERVDSKTMPLIYQRLCDAMRVPENVVFVDMSVIYHPDFGRLWKQTWTPAEQLVHGYWMATLRLLLRREFSQSLIFHWLGSNLSRGTPLQRLARFCAYLFQTPLVHQTLRVVKSPWTTLLIPSASSSLGSSEPREEKDEKDEVDLLIRAIETHQPWTSRNKTLEFIPGRQSESGLDKSRILVHSFKMMNHSGSIRESEEALRRILATIPDALATVDIVYSSLD